MLLTLSDINLIMKIKLMIRNPIDKNCSLYYAGSGAKKSRQSDTYFNLCDVMMIYMSRAEHVPAAAHQHQACPGITRMRSHLLAPWLTAWSRGGAEMFFIILFLI